MAVVRQWWVTETIACVLILGLLLAIVTGLNGCALLGSGPTQAERLQNALTVEEYRKALDVCVDEGKSAKSFAVYEQCAAEADKRYGAGR